MEYLVPGVVGIISLGVGVTIGVVSVKVKNAFSSMYNEIGLVQDGINERIDSEMNAVNVVTDDIHRQMDENKKEIVGIIDSRCDSLAHKIKELNN
jgi:archaellum component FlaC